MNHKRLLQVKWRSCKLQSSSKWKSEAEVFGSLRRVYIVWKAAGGGEKAVCVTHSFEYWALICASLALNLYLIAFLWLLARPARRSDIWPAELDNAADKGLKWVDLRVTNYPLVLKN